MASLECKLRQRNGCYLFSGMDCGIINGQRLSPGPGSDLPRDVMFPDVGPQLNRGQQSLFGRAHNQETISPDGGPVISSPDYSEDEDLNTTVKEQNVDEPKEVDDQTVAGMAADETAGKAISSKSKTGALKKKRKSQLELLGVCTNAMVKGLVLRSGRTMVGSDTPVVVKDVDKDAKEDEHYLTDDEAEFKVINDLYWDALWLTYFLYD